MHSNLLMPLLMLWQMKDENEQLKVQSQTMQDKCAAALSGAFATARSVDLFCFVCACS